MHICPNMDLFPHPQKLLKLKNFVLFVFYGHFHFQDGISQLLTINGSEVTLETYYFSISGSNPSFIGISKRIRI